MGVSMAIMIISVLSISSLSEAAILSEENVGLLTPRAAKQLQWFVIGTGVSLLIASFNFNLLRELSLPLYLFMILMLFGLFFVPAIQSVHRWYYIPGLNVELQPSELAKIIMVIVLAWFLERQHQRHQNMNTLLSLGALIAVPMLLILKQPDLGSAIVLAPISLGMLYFSELFPKLTSIAAVGLLCVLLAVLAIFIEVIPFEDVKSYASLFLREYQMDRFDPHSHHHKTASTAIALGGFFGVGWRNSEYSAMGWLPTPETDSIFPTFIEQFGFVGCIVLFSLFYALLHYAFEIAASAKTDFGKLLSCGVAICLSTHLLINIGMMCGFLPITGVPLVLMSYGGSSTLATMISLGLLQSVYIRRFTFS